MDYIGPLYAKLGNKYVKLREDSAYVDGLVEAIKSALLDLECAYDINGESMTDSDPANKLRAALRAAKGGK